MKEIRPIDKRKPSNKRCVNCAEWPKATKNPVRCWSDPAKHCGMSGKDINYWNRCALFSLNPDKLYKEDNHDE